MPILYTPASHAIKPAQAQQIRAMQVARPEAAAYRLRNAWILAGYTSVDVRFNGIVEPSYDGCVPLQDRRASHRAIVDALRRGQHFSELANI